MKTTFTTYSVILGLLAFPMKGSCQSSANYYSDVAYDSYTDDGNYFSDDIYSDHSASYEFIEDAPIKSVYVEQLSGYHPNSTRAKQLELKFIIPERNSTISIDMNDTDTNYTPESFESPYYSAHYISDSWATPYYSNDYYSYNYTDADDYYTY
ncbi:hypothetical protein BB560_003894 [Smittium megazygosporum]|uniref:Uncharacterized protein n=1 Tax=Smittium megazygosporum TaxID=133381 RepID=A0A2T9ZAQ0_9FUNG|nr:hypothetical protein BB560_003894 [Smittium megazygosporum]